MPGDKVILGELQGRPAAVTVTEGLWAVATGASAHRSIDELRPVELSEFGLG